MHERGSTPLRRCAHGCVDAGSWAELNGRRGGRDGGQRGWDSGGYGGGVKKALMASRLPDCRSRVLRRAAGHDGIACGTGVELESDLLSLDGGELRNAGGIEIGLAAGADSVEEGEGQRHG